MMEVIGTMRLTTCSLILVQYYLPHEDQLAGNYPECWRDIIRFRSWKKYIHLRPSSAPLAWMLGDDLL
jgi:hypothetical protein